MTQTQTKGNVAKKQAEKHLKELANTLKQGKSDALINFLNAVSRFRNYSLNNVALIASQCPEAKDVKGFREWQRYGRFVKRGEKGIVIIAPLILKNKDEGQSEPRGFKAVHVFDVSQTEGKPLPTMEMVTGNPGVYTERLKAFVHDNGISLEYDPDLSANGRSKGGIILLRPDLSAAEEFSVLVHELAHEKLHHGERKAAHTLRETEAEAVSYIVSRAIGLNCGKSSAEYIQYHEGDVETLTASLDVIRKIARDIIEAIQLGQETAPMIQRQAA